MHLVDLNAVEPLFELLGVYGQNAVVEGGSLAVAASLKFSPGLVAVDSRHQQQKVKLLLNSRQLLVGAPKRFIDRTAPQHARTAHQKGGLHPDKVVHHLPQGFGKGAAELSEQHRHFLLLRRVKVDRREREVQTQTSGSFQPLPVHHGVGDAGVVADGRSLLQGR